VLPGEARVRVQTGSARLRSHPLGTAAANLLPVPAAPGARGEWSPLRERDDRDTDDGRTDLERGFSLSPPFGSLWVYPKRGRGDL
jgi:hypothetical protein